MAYQVQLSDTARADLDQLQREAEALTSRARKTAPHPGDS